MVKYAVRMDDEPLIRAPTRLPNQAILALPLVALKVFLLGASLPSSCK